MDEGAGELETALHPAREAAGPRLAGVPQLDELEDLLHATPAPPQEEAE